MNSESGGRAPHHSDGPPEESTIEPLVINHAHINQWPASKAQRIGGLVPMDLILPVDGASITPPLAQERPRIIREQIFLDIKPETLPDA